MADSSRPSRLAYQPAAYGAAAIQLDGTLAWAGTAAPLRGRKWDYELTRHGLQSRSRAAREVKVPVTFTSPAAADELRHAADRDVASGSPGELVVDGEWRQRCYVVAFEPDVITRTWLSGELTVALLAGVWVRDRVLSVSPRSEETGYPWLDLPCDLPADLQGAPPPAVAEGAAASESDVRLVFWGPCTDPYVTVAGNRYAVDATVPEGGRLVVDGHSWPKSITLVGPDGSTQDLFAKGHRGRGEGRGEYCFQRLPAGSHEVAWPGTFGFDLHWYEEEGEPPWARS